MYFDATPITTTIKKKIGREGHPVQEGVRNLGCPDKSCSTGFSIEHLA